MKGRGQPRVLYWFRTPPAVKVGRAALDEEAIRLIEEHNPEIEFDWTRILKGEGNEPTAERSLPQQHPRAGRPTRPPSPPARAAIEPVESPPVAVVDAAPERDAPVTAAEARLGAEGLARLRGRFAEMLARITDRIAEAERQAELKTVAERLNPDAWVTTADVLAGLDAYEATFESLRVIVGHGRRGSRRRHSSLPGAARVGVVNEPEGAE